MGWSPRRQARPAKTKIWVPDVIGPQCFRQAKLSKYYQNYHLKPFGIVCNAPGLPRAALPHAGGILGNIYHLSIGSLRILWILEVWQQVSQRLPKAQGTNEYIVNISFTSIYCHLGCPAALTHPPRPARISCPKARNAKDLQNLKYLKDLNRVGGGWLVG